MRDIGTTISGMTGRGSIRHNNREFTAANVDRERSAQNVVFVNENLKQVYHELFDEALETYNAGKKKTRDKIPDYENMELKEALEEERSFSDRLLEDIDRVLDMLERHLPRQLLHLVDKARELLPEHQTYRQQQQRERGHSWDDMSL